MEDFRGIYSLDNFHEIFAQYYLQNAIPSRLTSSHSFTKIFGKIIGNSGGISVVAKMQSPIGPFLNKLSATRNC